MTHKQCRFHFLCSLFLFCSLALSLFLYSFVFHLLICSFSCCYFFLCWYFITLALAALISIDSRLNDPFYWIFLYVLCDCVLRLTFNSYSNAIGRLLNRMFKEEIYNVLRELEKRRKKRAHLHLDKRCSISSSSSSFFLQSAKCNFVNKRINKL